MDEHPIEKIARDSIDYLIRENTTDSWAEAIAIIIGKMKDKDGLFCMPRLHDDYAEHVRLCGVLASTLRMFIDSNILASIPPNRQKKEWQELVKGVRVDGSNVVIFAGNNEAARDLCGVLLEGKST